MSKQDSLLYILIISGRAGNLPHMAMVRSGGRSPSSGTGFAGNNADELARLKAQLAEEKEKNAALQKR